MQPDRARRLLRLSIALSVGVAGTSSVARSAPSTSSAVAVHSVVFQHAATPSPCVVQISDAHGQALEFIEQGQRSSDLPIDCESSSSYHLLVKASSEVPTPTVSMGQKMLELNCKLAPGTPLGCGSDTAHAARQIFPRNRSAVNMNSGQSLTSKQLANTNPGRVPRANNCDRNSLRAQARDRFLGQDGHEGRQAGVRSSRS